MRRVTVLLALGACGRIGFDDVGDGGTNQLDASVPFVEAAGVLDPAFGVGGQVVLVRGADDAQMFDVRPRTGGFFSFGRVLNAGSQLQLLAWTPTGQLDPQFSGDGVVELTIETNDWGFGMLPLADRRLLLMGDGYVVGDSSDDAMFAILDENGVPDPSYGGGDGLQYVDLGSADSAYRAIETSRGVAVCGTADRDLPNPHHLVLGLRRDGSIDTAFGSAGVVTDDDGGGQNSCYDIVVDGAGRIVTVGSASANQIVTRYDVLGARDPMFANGGRHRPATSHGEGRALAIAPDGDIVFAGSELDGAFIGRLTPDGNPRATFGVNGIVKLRLGLTGAASTAMFYDVLVQPNDKIVAVGYREVSATNLDGVIVRLLPDGTLDPSFGTGGMIVLDIGDDDTLNAVYAESGSLIAVGSTTMGIDRAWIVRLR